MDDKNFIKENIVGRGDGLKRQIRHYVRILCSALIFGLVSAGVFVFAEPIFRSFRSPEETVRETIALVPTEESRGETSSDPSQALRSEEEIDGTTSMQGESNSSSSETETERETDSLKDTIQSEIQSYRFTGSQYENMMQSLRQVGQEAEKSLVEVRKYQNGSGLFGDGQEEFESYSGMLIARTQQELLIFTSSELASGASRISVDFLRGNVYEGEVREVDILDGFSVLSVSVSQMEESVLDSLELIQFGNSKALQRGEAVLAIGAPAGEIYSYSLGQISYINYNQMSIDGTLDDIRADLSASPDQGSFLLNVEGELIGWVSSRLGENAGGFVHVAGISDYLRRLEIVSNGEKVPYMGVEITDFSSSILGEDAPQGVYVAAVEIGSPAYDSGIQAGDYIISLGGVEISSTQGFQSELEKRNFNDTINVAVLRAGSEGYEELTFPLVLGGR